MIPRTKIISTIGPASSGRSVLRKMMVAGMDVVRLNFSHGTHEAHLEVIRRVRELNRKYRRHIRILQDLEGFRIRIGKLKGNKPIPLKKRQTLLLTNRAAIGNKDAVPFEYDGSLSDIKTGSLIHIDDGSIVLEVKSRSRAYLKTEVAVPGLLRERKGMNIPGIRLRFRGLKEKDVNDIEVGIKNGVDFIAQSFVRNRKDILELRKRIGGRLPGCKIIAKIENRDGIKNLDEILDAADGIMIARGDMGVSLPIVRIPMLQKMIIRKCNRKRKFVITATQMLESMTENRRPTRAEVSDVANAILDGTDYAMLSGETAAGSYPAQAVEMMNEIIKYTEKTAAGYRFSGRS